MDGEKTLSRFSLEEHDLPLRGEPAGKAVERNIVDQQREQLFTKPVGELIFVDAPFRGEPFFRHKKEHGFAAGRCVFERTRPALARGNAAFGIGIEKNIVRLAPPFRTSQSLIAIAQSSFLLEWLMNNRDKLTAQASGALTQDRPPIPAVTTPFETDGSRIRGHFRPRQRTLQPSPLPLL
jgi:hypothetical protein